MGPSSKDFFGPKWDPWLRIFGEKVTHLGGTSLYALKCEYPPGFTILDLGTFMVYFHFWCSVSGPLNSWDKRSQVSWIFFFFKHTFLGGWHFLCKGGSQIYWGHKFLERKIGGHKIFDDQNVGSHKMTTDSVFILFKKTDFNTILACLGVRCIGDQGVIKFVAKIGGVAVLSTPTFL